jgi:DNA-binding transcriptional ArsR family regulator
MANRGVLPPEILVKMGFHAMTGGRKIKDGISNVSFDGHKPLLENASHASSFLRVLSNEKRLSILCQLLDVELSVQNLQDVTGMAQSTVSQQLAVLRGEHLVKTRREAQSVFYSIKSEDVLVLLKALQQIYSDPR